MDGCSDTGPVAAQGAALPCVKHGTQVLGHGKKGAMVRPIAWHVRPRPTRWRRRPSGRARARPSPGPPPRPPGEPTTKPAPRAGTRQALMIEMLKRPEGATVEQIAAATGWQRHTIRGAISGVLKKKLGLAVGGVPPAGASYLLQTGVIGHSGPRPPHDPLRRHPPSGVNAPGVSHSPETQHMRSPCCRRRPVLAAPESSG